MRPRRRERRALRRSRRPSPGHDLGRWAPWWWGALGFSVLALPAATAADIMHRLHTTRGIFPAFANPIFNADWDRGFGESLSYVQPVVAAVAILVAAALQRRAWTHLVLAATFLVIVADDAFELHENWGGALSGRLAIPNMLGVRGQDIGELLVWALIGIPVLVLLAATWVFSHARARHQALLAAAGIALLAVFAAGFDLLYHITWWWDWSPRERYLVTLVESVGEMASTGIIMLTCLWFAFRQIRLRRSPRRGRGRPLASPARSMTGMTEPADTPQTGLVDRRRRDAG